ncbi:OmpA family protein [Robertkochia sediminum]|uniref:OmpA family protein n=1 Tax=Robertkochia sediminum TaxID=2785326 RepID=UPI001931F86B|nr:OmpA family protein [Robertkochia sediminum]MBL7474058.1 OmpA family protein [Robertkochia sediminum]
MDTLKTIVFALFLGVCTVNAQEETNFWQLGIGYNFVDDSGPRLNDYFNFKEIWHAVPYPSRLTVGYYLINGFGFEAIGSYNEYDAGKIVDGDVLPEDQTYVALDGKISYDLNKIFGQTGWFDPYLMTGAGYTWIGAADRATFNAGGGFNIWFTPTIGFNLNSMAKWGLFTDKGTNHLQHSLGLIFKLGKKEVTKIDEEFEEMAQPESSIVPVEEDSVSDMTKMQDPSPIVVAALPERSPGELRMEAMKRDLEELPVVYFAFNSSYLTPEDKVILDQLIAFMNAYPEAVIEVHAHADARGTDEYNDWLAQRRAKRIADYAQAGGISTDRIKAEGFGEKKILNRCINGVSCSESEHRTNRRTNYVLISPVTNSAGE